jgi:uncharacterized protein (DUF58 family)
VSAAVDEVFLDYAVRWRTGEARSGKHGSRQTGIGGNFRGVKPFWQLPDARRIDVRRSITDPFETLMVRETENRGSIAVVLACDLSASMQAAPAADGFAAMAALTAAAARSAHRAADRFGFIGFDEVVRDDFLLPLTRARGAASDIVARLTALRATGRHARGMLDLAAHVPDRRCLVLLVSDFLVPFEVLEAALASLALHDVAPVVLTDMRQASLPRAGLLRLRDAESGRTRLVLMRPSVLRRWQAARVAWRTALAEIFARYCRPAIFVDGALDMAALGDALMVA